VEDGQTGLVVPSGDDLRLAVAIDGLLRDRDRRLRFGAAAKRRAFAEYGAKTQARRYEQFYRELVEGAIANA
jgi:glycosyltransferase involved in cell wall biosynthesis